MSHVVTRMRQLLLAIFVLSGCAPTGDFAPKPNQEEVIRLVWNETFHTYQQPPAIGWRTAECGKPTNWFDGWRAPLDGFVDDGECKVGFFQPDLYYINVLWPDAIYRSGLVHELWHARLFMLNGDPDPEHKDPGFADGGIVDVADRMLIDKRL